MAMIIAFSLFTFTLLLHGTIIAVRRGRDDGDNAA
jgi:hypothetical protein